MKKTDWKQDLAFYILCIPGLLLLAFIFCVYGRPPVDAGAQACRDCACACQAERPANPWS